MKKILHLISSPRGESSYSVQLAKAIIEQIQSTDQNSTIKEINLATSHFPHLEESHLTSFFTPPENRTSANLSAIRHSDVAVAEIMEADEIVIGAPMYNFGIPSALKAWIDHICRSGLTFTYGENGPKGLIKNKKVYVAMSSGGIYSDGPAKAMDFVTPYLTAVFGFLGITDVRILRVEGTSIPGIKDQAMAKAIAGIDVN
ncbi:MAG: NAD(P)H-dependent oxidoreductase [Pedobacter sp.]|nr:NAD(P)H-dependent oxidoreductase [Pedobacter sp.]MDQ8052628.1 NAD(P)H-dependent oxidoreductase [Pedobacter sp.]